MVFQKKGGVKAKQQSFGKPQNKKQFEDDPDLMEQDSEDEDDSDEPIQKTPSNRGQRGKQVLSDKKQVSFQIPGKNTPAKTPKGGNQAKKPQTPGKASLQEFKGIGGNAKNGKAKKQDDSDEDDDDEDSDDVDFDEDADLDMMLGDDDSDEEEDDDDDDDDEEEDEEEEEISNKKQNSTLNQSKNAAKKTPVKSEKTPSKIEKTPKNKTPVQSNVKSSPLKAESPQKSSINAEQIKPGHQKLVQLEADNRRERDLKTLYLGQLPNDVTSEEIKALSSDIVSVSIPRRGKKMRTLFAFVAFASEAKAEENMKSLQKKKLRNQPLNLDFTGVKSTKKPDPQQGLERNFKKLTVNSISEKANLVDVAKMFPKATQVSLFSNEGYKSAAVTYYEESDAAADLENSQGKLICGSPFVANFGSVAEKGKKKRKRPSKSKVNPQVAKKRKLDVKEESDDDDDDDDEDDD